MTNKLLKYFLFFIGIIVLLVLVIPQYRAEKYITDQKEKYGILENRNRVSVLPFSLFLILNKTDQNRAFDLPYMETVKKTRVSIPMFDSYIVFCYYGDKEINLYLKTLPYYSRITFWENYLNAIKERNIDFLLSHSYDTNYCTDCLPTLSNKNNLVKFQIVFNNHLNLFANNEILQQYKYTITKHDSIMRVNYSIDSFYAEEGAYNLIFAFVYDDDKYKLIRRYTVP